jgi:hypothetical protein
MFLFRYIEISKNYDTTKQMLDSEPVWLTLFLRITTDSYDMRNKPGQIHAYFVVLFSPLLITIFLSVAFAYFTYWVIFKMLPAIFRRRARE